LFKKFRVYENQLKLLIETDDKSEAVKVMNNAHLEYSDRWHELFEYWDGRYNGIRQYKPRDSIIEEV